MPDIAALSVKVIADTKDAEAGLLGLEGSMSKLQGSIAGLALGTVAVGIAGIGAAVGASVKSAADFESTMSGVKAVSGATGEEMQSLSALALQLGKDTAFSAQEAGQGIEELVKGGLSIADVMGGGAKAALDLAAAGEVSVAEAATITANALNQFGLSGDQASHAADLIAGAANASSIDVHDFGFSLASVGAVANTVGLSFDDTAVAIAEMGKAGIKGSDAGTSLKTMFLNLQPHTAKQSEEFNKLGLETFNTQKAMDLLRSQGIEPMSDSAGDLVGQITSQILGVKDWSKATKDQQQSYTDLAQSSGVLQNAFFTEEGKAKSLAEIQGVLADATKDMTQEQKLASLQILFGTDAVRAAAILTKEGAQGFEDMAASMGKVTAAEVGAERLNNLNGSLEQLKGSLETAAITLGAALLPALRSLVDAGTQAVNDFIPTLEQIGTAIAQLIETGDLGVFTDNIKEAFGIDISGFVGAMQAAAGFITDTLIPDLGALAGFLIDHRDLVIGLVAAWLTFQAVSTVIGIVQGLVAGFTLLNAVLGLITLTATTGGLAGLGPLLLAILGPVGLIAAAVGLLAVAWINNWGDIQGKTAAVGAAVIAAFQAIMAFIGGTFIPGVGAFFSELGTEAQIIVTTIGGFFDQLGTTVSAALTALPGIVGGFFSALGSTVQAGIAAIGGFFSELGAEAQVVITAIGGFFSAVGTQVQAALGTIGAFFDQLGTSINAALTAIPGLVGSFFSNLGSLMQAGWQAILAAAKAAWDQIPADIQADLILIGQTLIARFAEFVLSVQVWGLNMLAAIQAAWDAISAAVIVAWTAITAVLQTTWDAITAQLAAWLFLLVQLIQTTWTDITTQVTAAWTLITTTLQTTWDAITAQLAAWLFLLVQLIQTTWTDITTQATVAWTAIGTAIQAVWTTIIDQLKIWLFQFVQFVQTAWTDITTQATTGWDVIRGAIQAKWDEITTALGNWIKVMIFNLFQFSQDALLQAQAIGQAILDGITGAITAGQAALGQAIGDAVRGLLAAAKSILGIGSPSQVFYDEVGVPMGEGLLKGFTDSIANGTNAVLGVVKGLIGQVGGVIAGQLTTAVGGDVESWLKQAIAATGVPETWLQPLLQLTSQESGTRGVLGSGDPNAVNPVTVNGEHATGLLQTLPSTFQQFMPGGNIFDPVQNAIAAIRHILAAWQGDIQAAVNSKQGYDLLLGPGSIGDAAQQVAPILSNLSPATQEAIRNFEALSPAAQQDAIALGLLPPEAIAYEAAAGNAAATSAALAQGIDVAGASATAAGASVAVAGASLAGLSPVVLAAAAAGDTFAQQQQALALSLAGLTPPAASASAALSQMGALMPPLVQSVAEGSISTQDLATDLVTLGSTTGLAVGPLADYQAGQIDLNEALLETIDAAAAVNPAFGAISEEVSTTGQVSAATALEFLTMLSQMGTAPGTAAVVTGAAAATNTAVASTGTTATTAGQAATEWQTTMLTVTQQILAAVQQMSAALIQALTDMAAQVVAQLQTMQTDAVGAAGQMQTGVQGAAQGMDSSVRDTVNGMASNVKGTMDGLKTDSVSKAGDLQTGVVNELGKMKSGAEQDVREMGSAIAATITGQQRTAISSATALGLAIDQGLIAGINGGSGAVSKTISSVVASAIKSAEKSASASPMSHETYERVGLPLGRGIVVGIEHMADPAVAAIRATVRAVIDEAERLSPELSDALTPDGDGGAPWWAGIPAFQRQQQWAQSHALEHFDYDRLAQAMASATGSDAPRTHIEVSGVGLDDVAAEIERRQRRADLLDSLGRR